jgi:hypothetical protein
LNADPYVFSDDDPVNVTDPSGLGPIADGMYNADMVKAIFRIANAEHAKCKRDSHKYDHDKKFHDACVALRHAMQSGDLMYYFGGGGPSPCALVAGVLTIIGPIEALSWLSYLTGIGAVPACGLG